MKGIRLFRTAAIAACLSILLLTAGGVFAQPAATWTMVGTSGFGTINNMAISALATLNGKYYAATINSATGGQLWSSTDGIHWTQEVTPTLAQVDNNYAILGMTSFAGKLWVSTGWGGYDGQLWSYDPGAAVKWQQVINDPSINAFTTFGVFNNTLYVGTAVLRTHGVGASIYQYNGTTWNVAIGNGNGNKNAYSVTSLVVFNNQLYAAVADDVEGFEVWRLGTVGGTWTTVVSAGMGVTLDQDTGGMAVFNNQLYLGVRNGNIMDTTYKSTGGKLYHTSNGTSWSPITSNGFGDVQNIKIEAVFVANGWLMVTTYNPFTGMQVWSSSNGLNFTNIATGGFDSANNVNAFWNSSVLVNGSGTIYLGTFNTVNGGRMYTYTPPAPLVFGFKVSLPFVTQ